MNCLKHYIKLIRKAESRRVIDGYVEKHHVFPRSIFGENTRVVLLTAKEHYIAHFLLWKLYRQRYGTDHYRTKKMYFAFNQMTWQPNGKNRYVSRTFEIARKCASIYNTGDNNPAKKDWVREKIRQSKLGVPRKDMKGKSYFGADDETIRKGIEKMREKKTGMKINYPSNRKSAPCTAEKAEKIRQSRLQSVQKYVIMDTDQFKTWIYGCKKYRKDGRVNPNITTALKARNETWDMYFN